jgi:hypothetical protein
MDEQGLLTRKVCVIRPKTAERAISCEFRRSALTEVGTHHIGNMNAVTKETAAEKRVFGAVQSR